MSKNRIVHTGMMGLLGIALMSLLSACSSATGPTTTVPVEKNAVTELSLPKIYSDHMVLQRNKPIVFHGRATAGGQVIGEFAGKKAQARVDADGRFRLTFPAHPAGGPYTLTLQQSGTEGRLVLRDILIGEVWICSGQSNMQMPVYSGRPFWNCKNGKEEVAQANYPKIRLYQVQRKVSPLKERKDISGPGWAVCSPESVAEFSGVGYFFGRRLYRDLKVPIGLINSSWGGTAIESWISRDAYERIQDHSVLDMLALARKTKGEKADYAAEIARLFAAWEKRFIAFGGEKTRAAKTWKDPGLDEQGWDKVMVGVPFLYNLDGVVWYRKAVTIPAAWAGRELTLSLGKVDDCDDTYFNGTLVGSTGTDVKRYWAKLRSYTVPARWVKPGRAVIAVRVRDYFSNGGLMGPTTAMRLHPRGDSAGAIPLTDGWKSRIEYAADLKVIGARPEPEPLGRIRGPHFPTTLFNSMIAPWTVYPLRGAIWYQGESNAGRAAAYADRQRLMIREWRRRWNDQRMPFVFVQLAAYEKHRPKDPFPANFRDQAEPGESVWAQFREAQTETLDVPHTGMAVTVDVGDPSDIHPADKQSVGERLATEAQRICYDRKAVSAGPYYERMKVEGDRIRIFFRNVGSGLIVKKGPLREFAIAGADGKFIWAQAKIDGSSVLVWKDGLTTPVAVRYAWANCPHYANLYNREGFPACPFRTDGPESER